MHSLVFLAISCVVLCAAQPNGQDTRNPIEMLQMHQVTSMLGSPSIQLSLSKTKLNTSDWITVSWEVLQPTDQDWIGVFNHPLDLTTTPSKYRFCKASSTHLKTGKGSLDMYMLNMRHDNVFVLFTNGTDWPIAIAESDVLSFANPNEPQQGHLALADTPSQMRISWTIKDSVESYVVYGEDPNKLDRKVVATQSTYTRSEMCGAPANESGWMDPGIFYSAIMSDLKPRTRYFYKYGSDAYGFAENSFISAPIVGKDTSFKFNIYADMGQAEIDDSEEQSYMTPSLNTTRLISKDVDNGAELSILVGDVSYARGYVSQWEIFMNQIRDYAERVPFMLGPGNHEFDWPASGSLYEGDDSGGECGVAYEKRFPMPRIAHKEPWYSFEYGSMHFVMISTEHDFRKGSKQYHFVESDLASVNREKTPWLIVAGHRPMYIDSLNNDEGGGDLPVARDLRRTYEDMFWKYQVDVFFGGHHHSYQRSYPVFKDLRIPKHEDGSNRAPVYYVNGAAGAGSCTNVHRHLFRPWYMEKVDIVNHGFCTVSVNSTHMQIDFVEDMRGEVLDSLTLVQPIKRESRE